MRRAIDDDDDAITARKKRIYRWKSHGRRWDREADPMMIGEEVELLSRSALPTNTPTKIGRLRQKRR